MGTELAIQQDPCTQLVQVSEHLSAGIAKMMQLDSVQEANVILYTCLCEGITPLDFARKYHVVKGKPAMRADAMLAEWRQRTGGKHKVVENSPTRAAIKLVDSDGDESTFELTWDELKESRWPWKDADKDKTQGNLKSNWSTPTDRRNMLWARLISNTIRVVAPEISSGAYTPEELEDAGHSSKAPPVATLASQFVDDEPSEAEDVQDAEFTPAEPEPAKGSSHEAEEGAAESEEAPDPDKTLPGCCTKAQRTTLGKLIDQAKEKSLITDDTLQKSLANRGVNQINQLAKEQADEMIANLRGALGN